MLQNREPNTDQLIAINTLLNQKKFSETVCSANSLLKTYPNSVNLISILTNVHINLNDYDSAIEVYSRLLNSEPKKSHL